MKSRFFGFLRIILFPTPLHVLCCTISLLCCIPIIFPEICPASSAATVISHAGVGLLSAILVSIGFMLISVVIHMSRLSNSRAFSQLFKWLVTWGITGGAYVILAIAADVQAPQNTGTGETGLKTDTIHSAHEQLNGPASLVIPISPRNAAVDKVADAPNLVALERDYEELLVSYITQSPRWNVPADDDTFYTKPGHPVMVPPSPSGIPALVHVCFRRLVEGDPLPQGYTIIKPGENFPAMPEEQAQIPDFALDLGGTHFLLLAWRGSSHRETALRAINAAITATDTRMQPLCEHPTTETMQRMLRGRETYPGETPDFRLCEPLAQDGAYQAELYANPGEPGNILIYIKELQTDRTLRLLSFQARYSDNPQELFRHDIPGSMPQWLRNTGDDGIATIFPPNTPLFAIRLGTQRHYFDVAFEIWFKPSDVRRNRRMLLRRCYKVQAYEPPAPAEKSAPEGASDTPQT